MDDRLVAEAHRRNVITQEQLREFILAIADGTDPKATDAYKIAVRARSRLAILMAQP